jgi:tetratricopeptide (TPR) repeat protein
MDGPGLSMGDLLVAGYGGGDKVSLEPAIEPSIPGALVALMEAYGAAGGLEATLEILADENQPALASVPMRMAAGSSPEITVASAQFNTSALPPGRYLARGTLRQGGKALGHMIRPFRVATIATTDAAGAPIAAAAVVPSDMAMVLLGGLPNFDRKELLTPAMLTSMFAAAESRATGSKAAVKEARAGDLGAAAITALGEDDQALATFLKGLELYQSAQLDRAAMQFQNSMQMAPAFAPSRLYLGASLAEGKRHKDAAGLLQSASTTPPNGAIARIAGEEWLRAGQPAQAIAPLELAVQQPNADARTRKTLGIAYVLGGRGGEAVTVLSLYLDANPTDSAALLAGIFATYTRHQNGPQPATLATDKLNIAKWAKAYAATKGPMQPLVSAWVAHVQTLK